MIKFLFFIRTRKVMVRKSYFFAVHSKKMLRIFHETIIYGNGLIQVFSCYYCSSILYVKPISLKDFSVRKQRI